MKYKLRRSARYNKELAKRYLERKEAILSSMSPTRSCLSHLPQIPDWMAAKLALDERYYREATIFNEGDERLFDRELERCIQAMRAYKISLEKDAKIPVLADWDWQKFHAENFKQCPPA